MTTLYTNVFEKRLQSPSIFFNQLINCVRYVHAYIIYEKIILLCTVAEMCDMTG